MIITLTNDFHNTTVRLGVPSIPCELTISQVRRARRHLCGVAGCTCSGILGTRGVQRIEMRDGYRRIVITDQVDREHNQVALLEYQD